MKRYLLAISCAAAGTVLVPPSVQAGQAVTKANYLACRKERQLDEAVMYARAKQFTQLQQLMKNNQCIATQEGVPVTTLDGMGGKDKVVFVYNGWRFWTLKEALGNLE